MNSFALPAAGCGEYLFQGYSESIDIGDVIAIEVKLSPLIKDKEVDHLLWLKGILGEKLKEMIIVTTGDTAYRRKDGVAVIPLAMIGV